MTCKAGGRRALPGSGGVSGPPLGDEAACLFPSQYEEKDKAFKEQLSHLATLLPTLQVGGAGGAGLGAQARGLSPRQALSSIPLPGSLGHLLFLPQPSQQG